MKNLKFVSMLLLGLISCTNNNESSIQSKLSEIEETIDVNLDSIASEKKLKEIKEKSKEFLDSSKVIIEENLKKAESITKEKLEEAEKKLEELNKKNK